MNSFWIGLEYVADAVGMCGLTVGACYLGYRFARFLFRQRIEAPDTGAPEGDARSPFPRPTGRD